MRNKILILLVFFIAALNSINVSGKGKKEVTEEEIIEEDEEVSFKKAVNDFAKTMKQLHKYMIAEIERRHFEEGEINLLAEVIYWENWWTDKEKRAAYLTGAVVMNRVKSSKWPDTVHDVLYQRGQYATTKYFFTDEIPEECYEMAKNIYYNGTPDVPYNVIFQSMQPRLGKGYFEVVNKEYFAYGDA